MNLKALLVDDEINILKNLETVIPWESMGIDIVNLARNGQEALVSARQFKPDLILCDIRMPVMDGLSFIEQLRAEEMECEVIMLTGYKDFDYTRSAIQHGARDYVLKPINYEELKASVERIAVDIRLKDLKHRLEKKKWGKIVNLAYERVLLDLFRKKI